MPEESDPLDLSPENVIPLHLAPLQDLDGVELSSIDDIPFKPLDDYEDVLTTITRRKATEDGK